MNSCWGNYLWWPLSPFPNYLFPRQKVVQPALCVSSYLILLLTIRDVLSLLSDHLPSDSGLPVTVTWLLRILFDLISNSASKILAALSQLLIKIRSRIIPCVLTTNAPSLFSQYECILRSTKGASFDSFCCLLDSRSRDLKSENEWYWALEKSR